MQTVDDYKWRLLWKDSQRDDAGKFYGHSFYLDEASGRISLKDMSGDLPHETDDGVLWVDCDRPVRFSLGERGGAGGGFASFPLICERRSEKSMTGMRWADAISAVRSLRVRGIPMRVEVEPSIGELLKVVAEIVTLPKGEVSE